MSVELAIELEHETFGDYVRRVSIVSVLVITFFVYPTICQAVLNTFACFHIDTGSGQYPQLQRVRLCCTQTIARTDGRGSQQSISATTQRLAASLSPRISSSSARSTRTGLRTDSLSAPYV